MLIHLQAEHLLVEILHHERLPHHAEEGDLQHLGIQVVTQFTVGLHGFQQRIKLGQLALQQTTQHKIPSRAFLGRQCTGDGGGQLAVRRHDLVVGVEQLVETVVAVLILPGVFQRLGHISQHRLVEALFAAEVVVDHRQIGAGQLGDFAGSDLAVGSGEKALASGSQQFVTNVRTPDRTTRSTFFHLTPQIIQPMLISRSGCAKNRVQQEWPNNQSWAEYGTRKFAILYNPIK